ncbi:MAG: single-stranded-DNA-specific exonuclease RecJ [Betaproteobacteria bacterium]
MMELVRRPVPASAKALAAAGVPPVLARVYAARGIVSSDELDTGLAGLPPFALLKGIDAAATRLADAVLQRERILIVADYDADGATACAVGVRGLAAMGADVDFLVPNRFEYGYGLTPEIVLQAATRAPRLIVTVDNGIASHDGVAAAAALGIEVIVTDHHLPAATLPAPALIVNPNQPGCAFPSKHIAGVGVMFYVLLATRAALRERGAFAGCAEPNLGTLLDLVALGTVADVVRLDRVNRTLVAQGLARIRAGRAQPGVVALFVAADRDARRATTYDLGFVAGPRLNAAGRLADMTIGIRCLLADTAVAARPLATQLDRLNRERREVEATMQEEALAELAARAVDVPDADAYTLCLYRPEWHQGVVGIVASRLKDRFHRPTVVFARGASGELKGSGRSIAGFHLRDALDVVAKRAPGLVPKFGGHAFAAGLSLAEADLPQFAALFEAVAREQLSPAELARTLPSDGPLDAALLGLELADALRGGVWGQGFPAPLFDDTFAVVEQKVVGERHRKLVLGRDGATFDAIRFNEPDPLPPTIHAAYRLDVNEWNGRARLQLVVEWWRPVEPPVRSVDLSAAPLPE